MNTTQQKIIKNDALRSHYNLRIGLELDNRLMRLHMATNKPLSAIIRECMEKHLPE